MNLSKTSIYFSLIFLTFGCKSDNLPDASQTNFTYLALGDSYTIGEGVSQTECYPMLLQDSLMRQGITVNKVQVIARTGWTTNELAAAINKTQTDSTYHLVSLLIGVNNQYRGRSLEDYHEEFVVLLNRAIEFAGGNSKRVIVLSIPDWGVTPFAEGRDRKKIAAEIDAFNAINFEETTKAGAAYVDVTTISRMASSHPGLIAPDGLHPSGLMYSRWVVEVLPKAFKALNIK